MRLMIIELVDGELIGSEVERDDPRADDPALVPMVADDVLLLFTPDAMTERAKMCFATNRYPGWKNDPSYDWAERTREKRCST